MEELLKQEEGKTLEFKENASSLNGIVKTVAAFTNTAGGTIVVGVEDGTKRLVGLSDPLEDEMRITNKIAACIHPFTMPVIEIQSHRKKAFIIIKVAYSPGPYYVHKESERSVYVRFGSTNRVADEETITTMLSLAKNVAFDEQLCPNASSEMIDWEEIKRVFEPIDKNVNKAKAINLGILAEKNPAYASNGGILLFGKERDRFFPDAVLRCVRFLGLTRGEHTSDHTVIDAQLIHAVDNAIHFIEKNTRVASHIGRIKRIETPQYPPVAVREAIINALIHTDYAMKGSSINIAIFDDRIEITNPGSLPYGLNLKDAIAGASRIRNRVIARTFHRLRIIEQWGSGLKKIVEVCIASGLKRPKFEEMSANFRVTIYSTKSHYAMLKGWRKILADELRSVGEVRASDAALLWKVTVRTATRRLKTLVDEGIITKVRASKTDPLGKYVLSDGGSVGR